MLFAWLRPKQPRNGEALGFVQALALEAALPFTVLAAPGRNGLEVATFGPRSSELRRWLAKRADKRLFVLTAQASATPRRARDPGSRSRANPDRYRCRSRRQKAGRSMPSALLPRSLRKRPKASLPRGA